MERPNEEIRVKMFKNRIPQWRLAEALNLCENTIGRYLRKPLNPEMEKRFNDAIDQLIMEG